METQQYKYRLSKIALVQSLSGFLSGGPIIIFYLALLLSVNRQLHCAALEVTILW